MSAEKNKGPSFRVQQLKRFKGNVNTSTYANLALKLMKYRGIDEEPHDEHAPAAVAPVAEAPKAAEKPEDKADKEAEKDKKKH